MITANRYHDICCGHRVYGHESKCAHLHGHNYRIHFKVACDELDSIGRVMDFSVIKTKLCNWLEENFDHKMLLWVNDPLVESIKELDPHGLVILNCNPTAENLATLLVDEVAPPLLEGTGCKLVECTIEETRKCSVTYNI